MGHAWDEGYFTDIGYTHGYYREINPVFLNYCLLLHGITPETFGKETQHCELGFGQGVSINIHAAANQGSYFGTDFNPAQTLGAQRLASAAGNGAQLFDDSFEEFLQRSDLPQFDSISLHGIWSWISPQNRAAITEFARRKLKPGGIFYVSYNCFPGWAPAHPLRQVLALHDRFRGAASGNAMGRVDAALGFAEELFAAAPNFALLNPHVAERLAGLKTLDRSYLAHEYFNREWNCMYFTDVADELASAKLDYAGTAVPISLVDTINLREPAKEFLNKIDQPLLREQMRDYFTNQQFRKDIYLRGIHRLSPLEVLERLLDMRFVLNQTAADVSLKAVGALGSVEVEQYRPLVDLFAADDYAPKTLRTVTDLMPDLQWGVLREAIIILTSNGALSPCHPESVEREVKTRSRALNRQICTHATGSAPIDFLASPLTGGGVAVPRLHQTFLAARDAGKKQPADWAKTAWQKMSTAGHVMVKDGHPLTTPEENLAELESQAKTFAEQNLPLLKAHGIA